MYKVIITLIFLIVLTLTSGAQDTIPFKKYYHSLDVKGAVKFGNSAIADTCSVICSGDTLFYWSYVEGDYVAFGNISKWVQSGDSLYPKNLSSKVGIGTALPKTVLDVNGSFRVISGNDTFSIGDSLDIGVGAVPTTGYWKKPYSNYNGVYTIDATSVASGYITVVGDVDILNSIGNGIVVEDTNALKFYSKVIQSETQGTTQFVASGVTVRVDSSGLILPKSSSLPTGEESALFSLTTDNALYRHNGSYWQSVQTNHGIKMGCGDSTYSLSLTQNVPAPITNANNDLLSEGVDSTRGWYYSGDTIFASQDHGWVNFDLFIGVDGNNSSSLKPYIYKNGSSICGCGAEEELSNNRKVPVVFGTSTNVSAGDYFVPYLEDRGQTASTVINNVQFRVH